MTLLKKLLLLPLLLVMVACTPLEQQARNTAAALQGVIVAAQAQYQTTCTANASQAVCVDINKAVSAENALITATEAYCGWNTASPPANPNTACVPVSTATAGLQTAIGNATVFITQLKGAL